MQEIILKEDGTAVFREIIERPCAVVDHIVAQMSEGASRIIKRAGLIDKLPFHIVATAKENYAVMSLPFLTINAPWEVSGKDGLLRPNFNDLDGKNPSLPLKWPAQHGMQIVFAARIYRYDAGFYQTRPKESCFLLAMNSMFQSFLLPLPNIYDSGYMCMGDFEGVDATIQGAFEKAYRQLQSSKWNSDLLTPNRTANANLMMSFKPDGENFIPQPFAPWNSHLGRCESASIEILKGALKP